MTTKYLASTITNYSETIRTNADQNPKGLQTSCLTLDEIGIPLAYGDGALNWHAKEYSDTELNLSTLPKFWIEEIVDGVIYQHNYDGTNLTTYTSGTAGTPVPHTPENVNYTLGRGAYPTLSTDQTVKDVVTHFAVFSDDYDIYDQSKRYNYLQGV